MNQNSLSRSVSSSNNLALYFMLVLFWAGSGFLLSMEWVNQFAWYQKMFILFFPVLVTFVVTLSNLEQGFAIWGGILTLLVSQTGFQAQVGTVTTSALEIIIVVLLLLLSGSRRNKREHLVEKDSLPGYKWLFAFIFYSIFVFIFVVLRGDSVLNALIQFKGFLLYPLMLYLLLAGLPSAGGLQKLVLLMGLWYAFVSWQAGTDFVTNTQILADDPFVYNDVYRASGEYAPINIFGASVAAMSVLCFGVSLFPIKPNWQVYLFRILGLVLAFGAWTSVARGALILLGVGLFVLALLSGRKVFALLIFLFVVLAVIFYYIPPSFFEASFGRLFQMADSSTQKRWFYLESGWQALLNSAFLGAGWGKGYFYYPGAGLVPSGSIPWYHNDYLNLAVQVGVPGLMLYLGFWTTFLQACLRWLRKYTLADPRAVFVLSGMASLVGLLVAAFFDHLLWRPDMAGLVSWVAGVALIGMNLPETPAPPLKQGYENHRFRR